MSSQSPSASDPAGIAAMGVLGTAAQFSPVRAFTLAEAVLLAPIGYGELVRATLWGYIAFRQTADIRTIVGALVIAAAGLYVWQRERQVAARCRPQGQPRQTG